jgi:hypothetical protein
LNAVDGTVRERVRCDGHHRYIKMVRPKQSRLNRWWSCGSWVAYRRLDVSPDLCVQSGYEPGVCNEHAGN